VDGYMNLRDYGFLFWPKNHWHQWNVFFNDHYVQTGYYGLSIDVAAAKITRLGAIAQEVSQSEARDQGNSVIEDLPPANVSYSVTQGGIAHLANAFLNSEGTPSNPSRMIEMGRFMQRIDIPKVLYAQTTDFTGSVQLAAMVRHFVLTHRVVNGPSDEPVTVTVTLSAEALSGFNNTTWLDEGRAVRFHNDAGEGWSFIIPQEEGALPSLEILEDGSIQLSNTYASPQAAQTLRVCVLAVPSNAGGAEQLDLWLNPESAAKVQYAQMNLDGSGGESLLNAPFDPERGLYVVGLQDLSQLAGPPWQSWSDLSNHNRYNRHRLIFENNTEARVSIPVAFEGGNKAAVYIVGGSPMLRYINQEPTGAPLQISKNWHEQPFWYHLYGQLEFEPGAHELEHTFAHAKWGEAFAAAHAQLSLIGWSNKNQQWDESSLGAFGETITYDPDYTLGRAMVDDVRPFLVEAKNEWGWTGNVGGADFLVYATTPNEAFAGHQLGRLRTHYRYTGPNLTDVIYAGISRDNKIQAKISTQLGRTDDMVRAYYHLEYTFLQDVSYERLALFQIAADRYSDNGFTRYAYGNELGFLFDQPVLDHESTGYPSEASRGIPLEGLSPWVMLYDSNHNEGDLPEHHANLGFVVRDYEATIGDTTYTTPHINIRKTFNHGWSQMAFELGIPYEPGALVVPAGSVLRATVEYLVPPAIKSSYYGPSDYLNALPQQSFQSTDMMVMLASQNHLVVEPTVGNLVRSQPIEFEAEQGAVAVQFTLSGGLGYVPLTVRNLARPDGWRLERKVNGVFELVDQSVHGNDYWQAYERPETGSFDLIFNLKNEGTMEYRLTR